jgi:hypothetical protein
MDQVARREWELEDFTSSTILNGVEILIDEDRPRALVIFPWDADYMEQVRPAMARVRDMGYTTITEMGNLNPYRVHESPTDDCDYYLVEVIDD